MFSTVLEAHVKFADDAIAVCVEGGLDYNDRIDGASTPSGRPVTSPTDDDMRYMWTDDALPVTPAFLKNQLKYDKPRAQVKLPLILSLLFVQSAFYCPRNNHKVPLLN